MVVVAQLVERQIVVLDVAGSSPVFHPSKSLEYFIQGFFRFLKYYFDKRIFCFSAEYTSG